jgi:hypothetical protein
MRDQDNFLSLQSQLIEFVKRVRGFPAKRNAPGTELNRIGFCLCSLRRYEELAADGRD